MMDMHSTLVRREVRPVVRRVSRAGAVSAGVAFGMGVLALAGPAAAAPPEQWEQPDNASFAETLLILGGIPLAIIALIALFTYLPSMVKGTSTEPALAFQQRSEWFGGPRQGVSATQEAPAGDDAAAPERGGASARW